MGTYLKCSEFLPEHKGAIIFRIGQLLRLIFVKIGGNGKIYNFQTTVLVKKIIEAVSDRGVWMPDPIDEKWLV